MSRTGDTRSCSSAISRRLFRLARLHQRAPSTTVGAPFYTRTVDGRNGAHWTTRVVVQAVAPGAWRDLHTNRVAAPQYPPAAGALPLAMGQGRVFDPSATGKLDLALNLGSHTGA